MAALLVGLVAEDSAAQVRNRRWLTGRLLVATDTLRDPRFVRTVIFVVRHDAAGALGLVVNRPLGAVSFKLLLQPFGLEAPPGGGDVSVHYGGPVEERRGFLLHTSDWAGEDTTVVDGRFALTRDPKALQAMAQGAGPRRALFMLGYAGWAAKQLESELDKGAWAVALADERLVFEEEPGQKWPAAMARRLLDL
jgi:putative transcriptional regulator